jgi:hypothetical protein
VPALVVVALAAGSVALAVPAGAQTRRPVRPAGAAACARAQRQFARLVNANAKTKAAFTRAQTLQNALLRAGRVGLAHRLDARLTYLRSLHTAYVNRVAAIAARIQGRCSANPPQLVSY